MPGPWADLEELLGAQLEHDELEANIYGVPPAQLSAPAIVIRPDEPWSEHDVDDAFDRDSEHLAVIAVAAASVPEAAYAQLRALAWAIRRAADGYGAYRWRSTSGVVRLEDGGSTYLGATVRLTRSASSA